MTSPPFNFLLIDAASAGQRQDEALLLGARHDSFYKGDKEENRRSSPYQFDLQAGTPLSAWYFRHGWGQAWGVPVFASAPFEEVYRHFRKFLMVKTEGGQRYFFRFYDPRVLRIFLPTCDSAQLKEFFGPVDQFICEDEDPGYGLIFSLEQGNLKTERIPVDKLFSDFEKVSDKTVPVSESSSVMVPKREKSFTEFPLPYARLEADPETFQNHLSGLPTHELALYFYDVEKYYGVSSQGEWLIFSFPDLERGLRIEYVSKEVMDLRLEEAEKRREANEKAYSDSILKPQKKQEERPASGEEPKKGKTWSWLKI